MMYRILILLVSLSGVWNCSKSPTEISNSGGGSEVEVTGIIIEDDSPVSGAVVTLYPWDYNPIKKVGSDSLTVITNERGEYGIKISKEVLYNLHVYHPISQNVALVKNVQAQGVEVIKINIPQINLQKSGNISLNLEEYPIPVGGYIFIPGTGVFVKIGESSTISEITTLKNVPPGKYSIINITDSTGTVIQNVLEKELLVEPGEIAIQGPYVAWQFTAEVVINTSSTGADLKENVLNFPIPIRLDSTSGVFKNSKSDGTDLRFSKSDLTSLSFEIESWNFVNEHALIWVKIDTILKGNDSQFVHMHWGNAISQGVSNGAEVFDTIDGFTAVWHMNDNPDGDKVGAIGESTSNKSSGTSFGSMSMDNVVEGVVNQALKFNGVDNYIKIEQNVIFDIQEQITLESWVFIDSFPDSLNRDGKQIISKLHAWSYHIEHDGNVKFFTNPLGFDTNSILGFLKTSTSPIVIGSWYQIAATYDGQMQKIYINGTLIESGPFSFPINVTTADVYIGVKELVPFTNIKGKIDEVRVSNISRSAEWIRLCYQLQKPNSDYLTIK